MEIIELNPLDKKDLLQLLDYAKTQKIIHKPIKNGTTKWDDTNYWCMRIDQLKMIINGYVPRGSVIQSSYETIDYDMNKQEKNKLRYKKSLESDIYDVFDSKD